MKSMPDIKKEAVDWIEEHAEHIKKLSNTVWLYAEPPLQEFRSSALLARELEASGFKVERNVADLETAFMATLGEGKPVLATYAEYDATEGLSQMPVPYPCPVVQGAGGFQDMHNGLGAGAVAGALAVKAMMEEKGLSGTLKVFGTPAEKLCVGKPYMARAGLFHGLDAVIGWHPGDKTEAEPGWGYRFLALQGEKFIFKGTSVYGARPWDGTSALDGLTLMDIAVQYMREHILPPDAFFTINSIISDGGQAPTNLPGRAEAWYHLRALKREYVEKIREGMLRCAGGAALATGTTFETEFVAASRENLPNVVLAKAMHQNIELIGPPRITDSDKDFAREIERKLGREPSFEPFNLTIEPPSGAIRIGAADDFTEFSWIAPTHRVYVTYNMATSSPSWATAAFASMNIGHQCEMTAAKLIACTLLDLFLDPSLLKEAKREFEERTVRARWRSLIPETQPSPKRSPLPEGHYQAMQEGCKHLTLEFIDG
jgi:aminobenzoyl-glutamate utilization protein B